MNWQLLARANTHPLRISILEVINLDGGRALSPKDLSLELQAPLSTVNYHVTELAKAGLIEMVAEEQVRGAVEHFYRSTDGAMKAAANGSRRGARHGRARRNGVNGARRAGGKAAKRTTGLPASANA